MAKIVLSEVAPSGEAVSFSLGNCEPFTLGGSEKKSYETDDASVLAQAEAHPWLTVEAEKVDAPQGVFRAPSVKPEDDILAAAGHKARERAAGPEADAPVEEHQPVAIEAGLDQDKKVETEGVAQTLAADDTHKPAKRAPKRDSGDDDSKE